MSTGITEVVLILAAVNAVAVVVLVPLSFIISGLALDGLERLDLWMRRRDEKR